MKKAYYDNANQKKVGVALLISGKVDFAPPIQPIGEGGILTLGLGRWLNTQPTTLDR